MSTTYQPGIRISEYVLERPLGAGSFGEVWQGRHHVWSDDHVAIKLPTEPQYVRYLQREGVVVHGLRHPNIVRVLGLDPYAEPPYLVMELVRGPALRQLIDENASGLPLNVVRAVFRGVLHALAAAHEAGVIHRDLKPGNVLLDLAGKSLAELSYENVKLSDFGLGAGTGDALRSIAQSASLERDSALVGTLAYMAPEVRDGGAAPDARADLYAAGIMLFEMLTGERPAGAELPGTVRAEAAHLDDIFRKLYAHHERRYADAKDVLRDLDALDAAAPPPVPTAKIDRAAQGYVRRCKDCGGEVGQSDQFCMHCGGQLVARVRRCPHCDAYPSPDDKFCIFCGAALGESDRDAPART